MAVFLQPDRPVARGCIIYNYRVKNGEEPIDC